MLLISDGLLIAGALAAAFYCYVLGRRVRKLGDLDRGLGASITGLSQQVEGLRQVLASVKAASVTAQASTDAAAQRAERAANRLQLLLATTQLADERDAPAYVPSSRSLVLGSGPEAGKLVVPARSGGRQAPQSAPLPGELA